MAIKLIANDATYFIELCAGKSKEELIGNDVLMENYKYFGPYWKISFAEFCLYEQEHYEEAEALFNSIKLFDKPLSYRLDLWEFYKNVTVVGTYNDCIILVTESTVFEVPKSKYDNREVTDLDGGQVCITSWKAPYTEKQIADQERLYKSLS